MIIFLIMGLLSVVALALPIIILLVFKLAWYRSFPALFAFYVLTMILTVSFLVFDKIDPATQIKLRIPLSLLEPALLIAFLVYFAANSFIRKRLMYLLGAYGVYGLIIFFKFGISEQAVRWNAGPGLGILLVQSAICFIRQIKFTIIHQKAVGKALMSAAIFFTAVGYTYFYVVLYLLDTIYVEDSYMMFFLTTIISVPFMAVGIFLEQKRVRQLEELRTTREELKLIYGDGKSNAITSYEAIALKLEKPNN